MVDGEWEAKWEGGRGSGGRQRWSRRRSRVEWAAGRRGAGGSGNS